MIFSAAALIVRASIFLPMETSMRKLAASSVQMPAPSNWAAETWPALTSAEPMAWRSASTWGGAPGMGAVSGCGAASGALARAPSVCVEDEYTEDDSALAGNGELARKGPLVGAGDAMLATEEE